MMKSPIQKNDSISYFENYALQFHEAGKAEKSPSWLNPFLSLLKPKSRVLDLGCGSGIDLSFILKEGHEGVGLDASPKMVALAKTLNPEAQILNKNALFLNLKEAEFDGVWVNSFFNLFEPEQTQRMVAAVFKGLKPGGVMGVSIQEGVGVFEEREFDLNGPSKWVHLYTEKQICSMLDQTGFAIEKVGRAKGWMLVLAKRI